MSVQRAVEFFQVLAAILFLRQQALAHGIGHASHLHRAALGLDAVHFVAPADGDVGHGQRAKDVQAGGFLFHRGQVVVAHEQHRGHARVGEALDAAGELALIRGAGVARLEGVARKEHQVNVVRQAVLDHLVKAAQKVEHAPVDAGGRVEPAIVFHADVEIGQVEKADRGGHSHHSGRTLRPSIIHWHE